MRFQESAPSQAPVTKAEINSIDMPIDTGSQHGPSKSEYIDYHVEQFGHLLDFNQVPAVVKHDALAGGDLESPYFKTLQGYSNLLLALEGVIQKQWPVEADREATSMFYAGLRKRAEQLSQPPAEQSV